jgi:hypothetical protein
MANFNFDSFTGFDFRPPISLCLLVYVPFLHSRDGNLMQRDAAGGKGRWNGRWNRPKEAMEKGNVVVGI